MKISKYIYFIIQVLSSIVSFILRGSKSHEVDFFPVVNNYLPIINNLVKDKSVLNLGCCETSVVFSVNKLEISNDRYWFHRYLANQASYVFGIDIDSNEISNMKNSGFNVERYDLDTKIEINTKYDVIVAHHVIEHISNIKNFLSTVKKCLNKDGIFILKVFNARSWSYDISVDMRYLNGTDYFNPNHFVIHSPIPFINMLNKNGISVESGSFVCYSKYSSLISLFNKTKADDFLLICRLTSDI